MDELGLNYCFNAAYSPTYNGGIEETWAMAKQSIRKKRIRMIANKEVISINEIIIESMNEIRVESISKAVANSINLLNRV